MISFTFITSMTDEVSLLDGYCKRTYDKECVHSEGAYVHTYVHKLHSSGT